MTVAQERREAINVLGPFMQAGATYAGIVDALAAMALDECAETEGDKRLIVVQAELRACAKRLYALMGS